MTNRAKDRRKRPPFRRGVPRPDCWEVSISREDAEDIATYYASEGYLGVNIRAIDYGRYRYITEGYSPRSRNPGRGPNPTSNGGSGAASLYKSFHGAIPRTREVLYEPPQAPLVKIGRLVKLEYRPEPPSTRTGTQFYHNMGDTGEVKLASNVVLATDKDGKHLYIVKDKAGKRPYFTNRGVIG